MDKKTYLHEISEMLSEDNVKGIFQHQCHINDLSFIYGYMCSKGFSLKASLVEDSEEDKISFSIINNNGSYKYPCEIQYGDILDIEYPRERIVGIRLEFIYKYREYMHNDIFHIKLDKRQLNWDALHSNYTNPYLVWKKDPFRVFMSKSNTFSQSVDSLYERVFTVYTNDGKDIKDFSLDLATEFVIDIMTRNPSLLDNI